MANEKADIEAAIRDSDGNISKAARKLGVARRTLQNRMRFHGIPKGASGRKKRKITYGRAKRAFAKYAPIGATVAVVAVGVVALGRGTKKPPTSA